MRLRNLVTFVLVVAAQFAIFEVGLRTWGSSEAAPSFQGLFETDPVIGYRLRPHARTHFATSEFAADIAINGSGLRDEEELGPKKNDERRIVLLGDSLVLSVQVPFRETFGELLEQHLNAKGSPVHYRVINAGVQGYGPIEEQLFFRSIVGAVEPDLVLPVIFVGNDAEEAVGSQYKLDPHRRTSDAVVDSFLTRVRRLVRRSMVLQIVRLRLLPVLDRISPSVAPPEPPLQSYAAKPAPRIAQGLDIARRSMEDIEEAASRVGARSAIVLMPARFQVDDGDYGRLKDIVAGTGGDLIRDAASTRFAEAMAPLGLPMIDLLPSLREALPGPDLFYQETVHLTPRGHMVVAAALDRFIEEHGLLPR
jgi:lysophospholipase L1-like esterase